MPKLRVKLKFVFSKAVMCGWQNNGLSKVSMSLSYKYVRLCAKEEFRCQMELRC